MCHATCREPSGAVSQPCIYCHLDTDEPVGSDDEQTGGDSLTAVSELRFAPEDDSQLDAIFRAMSDCQALHPDEDFEPDSMADQFFTADNLPGTLNDNAMEQLSRYDDMLDDTSAEKNIDEAEQ
ncbi:hypothetical protein SARC_12448 [Sphaeroforma arctica JP610]|uniref:Uncharacterized protein n=1 Tax=Sphaeroforma arctica JP610 TaxID=667725 RepID=A0A0L0FE33_9EUKA|nr:hypothetical protein SARC_12448 [Sphaeroforma arctica JP610]KNC75019.1 hypothetical protein SARC_12448 [Sphaeroforma arctica JP610]|eukprot:XP_014148921.1 hypothetical protein SARC_12448 [Sphaeroforma arctica JP610]